jgi:proton-dependent oligopeptide transporter, POT family
MATTPGDVSSPALRPASDSDRAFFGHPRGLSTLFFSEMWERFSYYGMRAILVLFMVAPVETGGLGFSAAKAGLIYGVYTSMVYLLGVPGGWIADKFLGLRRAVLYGGVLIMFGHISLAFPATATFYLGLGLVMLGTGFLKPNISAMVGQLYGTDDPRRDSGFSIYYMGINIGALIAPLACGYLAERDSFRSFLESVGIPPNAAWHFGFGMAAVGMALGLVQYVAGWRHLGDAGAKPQPATEVQQRHNRMILAGVLFAVFGIPALIGTFAATGMLVVTEARIGLWFSTFLLILVGGLFGGLFGLGKWSADERRRLLVVFLLFFGAVVLWAVFEQAGSTLTLIAKNDTQLNFLGIRLEASWFQSINALFVIGFAPVFAYIWLKLARSGRDLSSPMKFGIGLVLLAAGLLVMVPAAQIAADGTKVSPMWLVGLYLLHTWAELCISPVGLSSMTKLAPAAIGGMVMGIWFLGAAVGNYIAGRMGGLYGSVSTANLLLYQVALPLVAAVVFFLLSGPIKRMLARSHQE